MNNLRRLDLNLLVTLDVLLSEHNVTRAAQRLNFSQPSVSVHLAKLRDIFDDPLLLPGPRGMRPTARAESLREPLRLALEALAAQPQVAWLDALTHESWSDEPVPDDAVVYFDGQVGSLGRLLKYARVAVDGCHP